MRHGGWYACRMNVAGVERPVVARVRPPKRGMAAPVGDAGDIRRIEPHTQVWRAGHGGIPKRRMGGRTKSGSEAVQERCVSVASAPCHDRFADIERERSRPKVLPGAVLFRVSDSLMQKESCTRSTLGVSLSRAARAVLAADAEPHFKLLSGCGMSC